MLQEFERAPAWMIPFGLTMATIAIALTLGFVVSRFLGTRLFAWPARTSGTWDDAILDAVKPRIPWWSALLGAWLSLSYWPLSVQGQLLGSRAIVALATLSVTLAAAAIASRLVADYGGRITPAVPVTTLSQNIAWILIVAFGLLSVLHGLGLSITPLVTAFGVGGLAVALALQDPLANFFAGLVVTLARHVRVGDYVKLDSGVEGEIVDFSWRLTRIRTSAEKLVLVPNAKLAQAIVTNYSLPPGDLPVAIELGVDAQSDLDQVERLAVDTGRYVMSHTPGGVPESQPIVRVQALGAPLVKLTVFLRASDTRHAGALTHEFLKRFHARVRQEGIVLRA